MLQPSASHIRELLDFKLLVPALRDAFVEGAHVPSRHVHSIEGDGGSGTSLLMPAWSDRGFYGVKIVNVFPRNRESGLPGLHSTYILYNAKTGEPLALLDGNEITSRRTAAASALAASFLAREDATHLLVIGAGRVGSLMAQAMAAVRNIARVVLWDIQREAARRCEAALRDQGFRVEVAEDLESAVRNADIVTCATLAERPLVQAQWLAPGSHLDLIGSFTPQMTEAAPACFAHASVWIDTEEALRKSGDLLNALQSGDLTFQALGGTLEDLCRHRGGRRARQDERTVFKAVGTALEDLAAATLVYHQLSR